MLKLKRFIVLVPAVLLLILFTACSGAGDDSKTDNRVLIGENEDLLSKEYSDDTGLWEKEDDVNNERKTTAGGNVSQNDHADGNEKGLSKNGIPGDDGIISITREEAGLSTIPELDISGSDLNFSIQSLLERPYVYSDKDYKSGLVYDENIYGEFIITAEWFDDYIIGEIKTGDSLSELTAELGEPSCIIENTLFYKTTDYYLGFYGNERVEHAIIAKKPEPYPSDILKTIIKNFSKLFYYDSESDPEVSQIYDFLEWLGYVYGSGSMYGYSNSGITMEAYIEDGITVYNNFEGELYDIRGDIYNFEISYVDTDFMMDGMLSALKDYILTNSEFEEYGVASPGGKYNSLYVWNNSQSQYFIIRALDNSIPDQYIFLSLAGEYYWLNDRYILYQDYYNLAPLIFDVETYDEINILEKTGLFEFEGDYYGSYIFEITGFQNGRIIIYCEDEDRFYPIDYSFGQNGEILLTVDTGETGND